MLFLRPSVVDDEAEEGEESDLPEATEWETFEERMAVNTS